MLYSLANFVVYTGCCVIAIIAAVHVTETLNECDNGVLKTIRGGLGALAVSICYSVDANS